MSRFIPILGFDMLSSFRRKLRPLASGLVAAHLLALSPALAQAPVAGSSASAGSAAAKAAPLLTPKLTPATALPASSIAAGAPAQSAAAQQAAVARQIKDVALTRIDPNLGKEIATLEKQINGLIKNVGTFEKNLKPVAQSATKAVAAVESFPGQVDAFKTKYDIPKNPTLSQEARGIGRFVKDKLGITPAQSAKVSGYVKSSPAFEQFKTPFQPSSILLAVGTAAGINIFSQLQGEDGLDVGKAFSFLGDSTFWGGLVGSGVGYGVMASVATMMFPAGAGLLPVLAPMFAGMTGSIFGWEIGSSLLGGESLSDALGKLSPATALGQAAGSTVGLLVGANVGAAIGGTLGSIAGPLGAIAGAVLMSKVGAQVGTAVKSLLKGDATDLNNVLKDAGATIDKIQKAGDALADVQLPGGAAGLPAASLANEGLPAKLKVEYEAAYQDLAKALQDNDRGTALLKIKYLQKIQARYEQSIGTALQSMSAAP